MLLLLFVINFFVHTCVCLMSENFCPALTQMYGLLSAHFIMLSHAAHFIVLSQEE